jgi:hypothetical protein
MTIDLEAVYETEKKIEAISVSLDEKVAQTFIFIIILNSSVKLDKTV